MTAENTNKYKNLRALICELVEGTITPERMSELNSILAEDPAAVEHYVDFLDVISIIKSNFSNNVSDLDSSICSEYEAVYLEEFWTTLAESEESAPTIIKEPVIVEKQIDDIYIPPPKKHKLNTWGLAACAAVLLFFVLLNYFKPDTVYSVEVASLSGSLDAQWLDEVYNVKDRLYTNKLLSLTEGLAQIQTDRGVNLTVEAPAVFEFRPEGDMYLHYGRVAALVSPQGVGFTISTDNAKVVDLGTEFGVYVDKDTTSEIHVFDGQVQYYSGLSGSAGTSNTVRKNEARRFDAVSGLVQVIPFEANTFARYVNPESGLVWRGQKNIDIANLVAGGNGFQVNYPLKSLNPLTGAFYTSNQNDKLISNNTYNLVENSMYIDGVFIPDGSNGPTKVTSSGLSFQCPDTGGAVTCNICAYTRESDRDKVNGELPVFGGIDVIEPVVLLHSNCGFTIDLDAIRRALPEITLNSVSSECGVTESILDNIEIHKGEVGFSVLIDGMPKYEKRAIKVESGLLTFDVPISPQDSFLTFIVTDEQSESKSKNSPWGNDYFYLVKPQINIEPNR